VLKWNLKIRHWFVKTVERNSYLVPMSSGSFMKKDLNLQRGAGPADKGEKCQEIHPVDLGSESSTPSHVRIAARRHRYLSSHREIDPFILIPSYDVWT
jgi:hypothetical protein